VRRLGPTILGAVILALYGAVLALDEGPAWVASDGRPARRVALGLSRRMLGAGGGGAARG